MDLKVQIAHFSIDILQALIWTGFIKKNPD